MGAKLTNLYNSSVYSYQNSLSIAAENQMSSGVYNHGLVVSNPSLSHEMNNDAITSTNSSVNQTSNDIINNNSNSCCKLSSSANMNTSSKFVHESCLCQAKSWSGDTSSQQSSRQPYNRSPSFVNNLIDHPPPIPRRSSLRRSDRSCNHQPRIDPIVQNGIKVSDTHYWMLPATPCPHPNESNPICDRDYVNMDCETSKISCKILRRNTSNPLLNSEHILLDTQTQNSVHSSRQFERQLSDKMQLELITRLQCEIPMAKKEEVHAVLVGASWNFDEASKRLKSDLLFKTGYVSHSRLQRLLLKHDWNLQKAMKEAKVEYLKR